MPLDTCPETNRLAKEKRNGSKLRLCNLVTQIAVAYMGTGL